MKLLFAYGHRLKWKTRFKHCPSTTAANQEREDFEALKPVPEPRIKTCDGYDKKGNNCRAYRIKGTLFCRHHQDQALGLRKF